MRASVGTSLGIDPATFADDIKTMDISALESSIDSVAAQVEADLLVKQSLHGARDSIIPGKSH